MGYTHYYNQHRTLTKTEWQTVCDDIRTILAYAQHECGIVIGNGGGEPGTSPEIGPACISFNGVGDDSHETFYVPRLRTTKPDYPGQDKAHYSSNFTKTARKPYDAAVTACLCYLTTITRRDDGNGPIIGSEAFTSTSDGDGSDFLIGLDLARKALAPRLGNEMDIPMDVMKADRWCAPWVRVNGGGGGCTPGKFDVRFCIDGRGYVLRPRTGQSYCFESHLALAQFLDKTKVATFATGGNTGWGHYGREEPNIWNATGSFDEARHNRLKRAQHRVLEKLFPVDPSCAQQPPAYVRPGEMPDNAGREFCYSVAELMNLAAKT